MTPTYLATATTPQIAAQIKAANPGSYIQSDQNGLYHIYTNRSAHPHAAKPTTKPKTTPKSNNILDLIIYGSMIIAMLLLILSK